MVEQSYTPSDLEKFSHGNKEFHITFKTGRFEGYRTAVWKSSKDAGHGDGSIIEGDTHSSSSLQISGVGSFDYCRHDIDLPDHPEVTVIVVSNKARSGHYASSMVETIRGQSHEIFPVAKMSWLFGSPFVNNLWDHVLGGMKFLFFVSLIALGLIAYHYWNKYGFGQWASYGFQAVDYEFVRPLSTEDYLGLAIPAIVAVISLVIIFAISKRHKSAERALEVHLKKCVEYLQQKSTT